MQLIAHVEGQLQVQAVRVGVAHRGTDASQFIAGCRFDETAPNSHRQRSVRRRQLRFDRRLHVRITLRITRESLRQTGDSAETFGAAQSHPVSSTDSSHNRRAITASRAFLRTLVTFGLPHWLKRGAR